MGGAEPPGVGHLPNHHPARGGLDRGGRAPRRRGASARRRAACPAVGANAARRRRERP